MLLVVAGGSGCGSNDEPATPKAPALTIPQTGTQSAPTTAAPPSTPESRFQRFCRENPGACG